MPAITVDDVLTLPRLPCSTRWPPGTGRFAG